MTIGAVLGAFNPIEFFQGLLGDFDPAKLLPEIEPMLSKAELWLRLAVMAGPMILLVLGVLYLLLPPKEANHSFGYRFFWGMSSVEAWQFTQRLAGIVWGLLGLVLTVVMAVICAGFRSMETMDMVWKAVRCILWELGLLAVSCVGIDVTLLVLFDSHGDRRQFGR